MEIKFRERHEEGLHCRFCETRLPEILNETSPIKGIVCNHCMFHLKAYTQSNEKTEEKK